MHFHFLFRHLILFFAFLLKFHTFVFATHPNTQAGFLFKKAHQIEKKGKFFQAMEERKKIVDQFPQTIYATQSCFLIGLQYEKIAQFKQSATWFEKAVIGAPFRKRDFQELLEWFVKHNFRLPQQQISHGVWKSIVFFRFRALFKVSSLHLALGNRRKAMLFLFAFIHSFPQKSEMTDLLLSLSEKEEQAKRYQEMFEMFSNFISVIQLPKKRTWTERELEIQKIRLNRLNRLRDFVRKLRGISKLPSPLPLMTIQRKKNMHRWKQKMWKNQNEILKDLIREREKIRIFLLSKLVVRKSNWKRQKGLPTLDHLTWYVRSVLVFELPLIPKILYILKNRSMLRRPPEQRLPVFSFAQQVYVLVRKLQKSNWQETSSNRLRNIFEWVLFDLKPAGVQKLPKILGIQIEQEYMKKFSHSIPFLQCHFDGCHEEGVGEKSVAKKALQTPTSSQKEILTLTTEKWFLSY